MERRTLNVVASPPLPGISRTVEETAPEKLAGFPTLRKTAELIGVDPATLSRRKDVADRIERRGRESLFPPTLVLELASYYRKRRLSAVASDLTDLAVEQAPDFIDEIEDEIDSALSQLRRPRQKTEASVFLAEAKRLLAPELYGQVESAYNSHFPITGGTAYLGDED
jgi:hypothetical protein